MVQIKEFRIVMPMSLEEYRVGELYTATRMQQQSKTKSEGIEIVENRTIDHQDFGNCDYTSKLYKLQSKIPSWLTAFAPRNALVVHEESWHAFPRCKTVLKCSYFSKVSLTIETLNVADRGQSENVHGLGDEQLAERQVDIVDIANTDNNYWNYAVGTNTTDFTRFKSQKSGHGPLLNGWQEKCSPVMTSYKLVTIDAPYWGFGNRLEQALLMGERALFLQSHRHCLSWIDEWYGMTLQDIRQLELKNTFCFSLTRQPTFPVSLEVKRLSEQEVST